MALSEGIYTTGPLVDPGRVPDFSGFTHPSPRSYSELRKVIDDAEWNALGAVAALTRAKILRLDVFPYMNDRNNARDKTTYNQDTDTVWGMRGIDGIYMYFLLVKIPLNF